jgi:hypothetical protein
LSLRLAAGDARAARARSACERARVRQPVRACVLAPVDGVRLRVRRALSYGASIAPPHMVASFMSIANIPQYASKLPTGPRRAIRGPSLNRRKRESA